MPSLFSVKAKWYLCTRSVSSSQLAQGSIILVQSRDNASRPRKFQEETGTAYPDTALSCFQPRLFPGSLFSASLPRETEKRDPGSEVDLFYGFLVALRVPHIAQLNKLSRRLHSLLARFRHPLHFNTSHPLHNSQPNCSFTIHSLWPLPVFVTSNVQDSCIKEKIRNEQWRITFLRTHTAYKA